MKIRLTLALIGLPFAGTAALQAQARLQEHWAATWATSPPLARVQAPPLAPADPSPQQSIAMRGFSDQTVRMIVRMSIGGHRLGVKLANAFGAQPVEIGAAHIALRAKDSQIVAASDRALLFNGWHAAPRVARRPQA